MATWRCTTHDKTFTTDDTKNLHISDGGFHNIVKVVSNETTTSGTASSGTSPVLIDKTTGVSYNEDAQPLSPSASDASAMVRESQRVTQPLSPSASDASAMLREAGQPVSTSQETTSKTLPSSTTTQASSTVDTRTREEREAAFYKALTDAKTAAANGNPKPLQDFDAFFKITRNPDEYKKAYYADYSHPTLSADIEREVRDWFIHNDKNNDGLIALDEMGENARRINKDYVGADGKLSIAEGYKYHVDRANSIEAKVAASGLPADIQKAIIEWHLARDLNKDGSIQRNEVLPAAWEAQYAGVTDDGKITVEESINHHRRKLGMAPIDFSKQSSGDLAPVATSTLSQAERTAMTAASTVTAPTKQEEAEVSVPEAGVSPANPLPATVQGNNNETGVTDLTPQGNTTNSNGDTTVTDTIINTAENVENTTNNGNVGNTSSTVNKEHISTTGTMLNSEPQKTNLISGKLPISEDEITNLKDIHQRMASLGLGFDTNGNIDFQGARGKDPDEVAALHEHYDSLSATEKQILAATWDQEFDTSNVAQGVVEAANAIQTEGNKDSGITGNTQIQTREASPDDNSVNARENQSATGAENSADREIVVGNETAQNAGSDANRHTKTVRTDGALDVDHSQGNSDTPRQPLSFSDSLALSENGESLAANNDSAADKVYVAKGGSVTKMIQDIAAENGQQINGKEAWKIYESMKDDIAKMDNTYTMHNGHVGLSKPGEMRVDSTIVSKIRDLSSGEGALSAARIDGSNTLPTSAGSDSNSLGLAGSTQVRQNSSGSSGLPSMP